MLRGKGRRPRDPAEETENAGEKTASSWAVEADHAESMETLHRFMLEHMGHGLAPGSVSGRPRSNIAEKTPAKAAERVEVDRAAEEAVPENETPAHSDIMIADDVKTPAPGEAAAAEEPGADSEAEQRAEVSPIALWALRLSDMERRNQQLFEQQRRHILQRAEQLMDEATELRALTMKGQKLSAIALPLVQQDLEAWFAEVQLRRTEIEDELQELLDQAPDLRGRLLAHPGAELLNAQTAEPRSPQLRQRAAPTKTTETTEETSPPIAEPEEGLDDFRGTAELRPVGLEEIAADDSDDSTDTAAFAGSEGPDEGSNAAADVSDEENNGDQDSNIVAWIDGIRPVVEFAPGLTLRSTAPPVDDLAEYRSAKAGLVVSKENHIDWRDLLYSDTSASQGADGQSHFIIKTIGGGNELGGACYMLEMVRYHRRILIDAGLRLRDSDHRLPHLDALPRPDLIIITHSHLDHCGALPHLVRKWPDVPIWCHRASVPLIEHSLRLLERQPIDDPLFVAPEVSLYSREEVEAVVLEGKETETPYRLFHSDLNLTFYPAGHTLGAVSFAVEGPQDSLFFTGEYAVHDEPSVFAAAWPERRFEVVIASCSGYADMVYHRQAMQERLIGKIAEIIADKAWAVFPVAEIGRAQDIFQLLTASMQSGRLPTVPIYWDGAQRRLAMLYSLQSGSASSPPQHPYLEEPGRPLDEGLRASLGEGPGILLANPGFLQDVVGRSLLMKLFRCPGSAAFLPMRPDSPLDLKPLLNSIRGDCEIHQYTWPSHPSEAEMEEQLLRLSPQAVLLVHGHQDIQCNLRAALPAGIIRRSLINGETLRVR